jgi:hypothetical protein
MKNKNSHRLLQKKKDVSKKGISAKPTAKKVKQKGLSIKAVFTKNKVDLPNVGHIDNEIVFETDADNVLPQENENTTTLGRFRTNQIIRELREKKKKEILDWNIVEIREFFLLTTARLEKIPRDKALQLLKEFSIGVTRVIERIGIGPGKIESAETVCQILDSPHRLYEAMRKRKSSAKSGSEPHVYRNACINAMVKAFMRHRHGEDTTAEGMRLPDKDKRFGDPLHRKIWWGWMRNYLVDLERKGKLELPIGTKYAQSGSLSQREVLRKKYFEEFYDDEDLEYIAEIEDHVIHTDLTDQYTWEWPLS